MSNSRENVRWRITSLCDGISFIQNCGVGDLVVKVYIKLSWPFSSVQISDIKYIHIAMLPSPLSIHNSSLTKLKLYTH